MRGLPGSFSKNMFHTFHHLLYGKVCLIANCRSQYTYRIMSIPWVLGTYSGGGVEGGWSLRSAL